jgi:hypothetical protein
MKHDDTKNTYITHAASLNGNPTSAIGGLSIYISLQEPSSAEIYVLIQQSSNHPTSLYHIVLAMIHRSDP